LLPISNGFAREKVRGSITAQIRDNHSVTGGRH
jgi:hypothetical protein